jgi:hypothetical protein
MEIHAAKKMMSRKGLGEIKAGPDVENLPWRELG